MRHHTYWNGHDRRLGRQPGRDDAPRVRAAAHAGADSGGGVVAVDRKAMQLSHQVAETLHKSIDTAIQLMGARGYSKDTPLEWMYRYARQARLVDGASEVHKMVVAREWLNDPDAFWERQ